jgi:uncharacterized membrane protein
MKAFKILHRNPQYYLDDLLDDLKKWAAFFASNEGGGMSYLNATDKALEILEDETFFDLDNVKKWAAFFVGKEGGGMTHLNAINKAFESLRDS